MTEKQYYQLDLVAVFSPVEEFGRFIYVENPAASLWFKGRLLLVPVAVLDDGDARQAINDHVFAEVTVPHHENGAIYGYNFHIFNKLDFMPAIVEAIELQQIIDQIHHRYGELAVCQNLTVVGG